VICEDCWKEAQRRRDAGQLAPVADIYKQVLHEVGHSKTPAPWCAYSRGEK
jgi:hypothetical protein